MIMSNDEPMPPTAPAVNQFGTPVGQFGSTPGAGGPRNQFGTPLQLGSQSPAGWAAPASAAPARRRSGGGLLWVVAALAVVVSVGVVLRFVVFPDLSKPIALPGTVAGVSAMGAAGQPVTLQSKDAEGRAVAVGVYADNPIAPRTMVVVTAGRTKNLDTGQITVATTTSGKVTCTDSIDAATLLQQSGAAAGHDAAAMRAFTSGAACWRTARHLTVLVVALTADGAAQPAARLGVTQAWKAV
jgi:hypothetical protein